MQTVSAKTSAMSTLLLGCSDSGTHLTGFAGSRCELLTPLQPLGHGHFALIRVRMGTVTGRTRTSCAGGNRFAEGGHLRSYARGSCQQSTRCKVQRPFGPSGQENVAVPPRTGEKLIDR